MKRLIAIAAVAVLGGCAGMMSHGQKVDVHLTGAQEVPPVMAMGSGDGRFTIASDGSVSGSVTTTGINGIMAHIHQGASGKNGPVIIPLKKEGNTYSVPAGAKLTPEQMQAFKDGDLYVNVHTPQHKGGEIRAQLQPSS